MAKTSGVAPRLAEALAIVLGTEEIPTCGLCLGNSGTELRLAGREARQTLSERFARAGQLRDDVLVLLGEAVQPVEGLERVVQRFGTE